VLADVLGAAVEAKVGLRRQRQPRLIDIQRRDLIEPGALGDCQRHQAEATHSDDADRTLAANDLAQSRVGGESATGKDSGVMRIETFRVHQELRVPYHDLLAMAAGPLHAQVLRRGALVVPSGEAGLAVAAADPGVDDHGATDIRRRQTRLLAERCDVPVDFMAEGRGRLHAQHGDGQVLIAAQAEMALLEVRVRMAKATARDVDHHVSRPRQRVGEDARHQRSAEFDDLKCSHCLNSCWMREARRKGGASVITRPRDG
jgi:hypothetical protein